MLQAHLGSIWIGSKVTERVKEAIGSNRRSILSRLTKDKVDTCSQSGFIATVGDCVCFYSD